VLTLTTYSEAGGVGKTTLAANLGVAETRAGRDVLAIDLDQQEGSLSYLLDVDDERDDDDADSLLRHMIDRPRGPFDDLIHTSEGVDIVPAHNTLALANKHLTKRAEEAADFGESFNRNKQLLRVLREAGVPDDYDTLIVDPPASEDVKLYNSIHATRHIVLPFEPTGKGQQSVTGLHDIVGGLEGQLGIEVGVLAVIPNRYKGTNDQEAAVAEFRAANDYPVPATFRERSSLFEGCWREQCSAFRYVEAHRNRERDYERETLDKLESLAEYLRSADKAEATA
jgi:cellulose biosynthesis protein BcsQ